VKRKEPQRSLDPAMLAAALAVAALVVASVTFLTPDTDVWQHLTVGRAIWQMHRVPTTQLWTWPTFGAPDVNASWGFRALIWPVWKLGGVGGLFLWRWVTTLAAFTLLWMTARRMGARGFAPLAVIATCAVIYRLRSQVRPETLVSVLLALEIWILETRRHGGPDRSRWLIPLALVWANCHISYFLFFVVLGAHAAQELFAHVRSLSARATGETGPEAPVPRLPLGLWAVGAASLLAMLINPWGWRALAQPFEYFFVWRHEPIFTTIGELGPVLWEENLWNGLPVVTLATPLLLAWRWRRRGPDVAEIVMVAAFATIGFMSVRFLGVFSLAVTPYLSRDLDEWLGTRKLPQWTSRRWPRAAGVLAVVATLGTLERTRPGPPAGIGFDLSDTPVGACDFIARHDVRGRAFNIFEFGGYLLYRFWPEHDRLPFMDIHQAGTRRDRLAYAMAFAEPPMWGYLDRQSRFDWILVRRIELPGDLLPRTLGADSSKALVFMDDVAELFVSRAGPLARLDSLAYRTIPPDRAGQERILRACSADSLLRRRVRAELERQVTESAAHSIALSDLSRLDAVEGRFDQAAVHLRTALVIDPWLTGEHERLGDFELASGHPREAIAEYRRAAREKPPAPDLDLRIGSAWHLIGDRERAREAWHRELARDPGNGAARDSLESLGNDAR
jgi:tetratricopeptide (TPR) repeat protein